MNDSHPGLWYIMPPDLLKEAIKHGNLRQAQALTRHAKVRWFEERPGQLQNNHVEEAILEAATAHCLGVPWLKRVNTDHSKPRLDLPQGFGGWIRVCPKWQNPARLKAVPKDYGVIISGRLHEEAIQDFPIMLVEVRAYALFDDIEANHEVINPGNRKSESGAPADCYLVPWLMKEVHPIEELVDTLGLKVPDDVMQYALPEVSDMIDFPPAARGKPSMKGWRKCNWCKLPNDLARREPTPCKKCQRDLREICYHCSRHLITTELHSHYYDR